MRSGASQRTIKTAYALSGAAFLILALHANATGNSEIAKAPETATGIVNGLHDLGASLNLIAAIKTAKTPVDPIALQTALNDVISLSEEEIKNLESQLTALNDLSDKNDAKRINYLQQLAQLRARYKEVRTDVNQSIDASHIIRLGQGLKVWRDATYIPTTKPMVNFSAVFANRSGIMTAHTRLIAVLRDKKSRLGIRSGETAAFLKFMRQAQDSISRATRLNRDAEGLLENPEGSDSIDGMLAGSAKLLDHAYEAFIGMDGLMKR